METARLSSAGNRRDLGRSKIMLFKWTVKAQFVNSAFEITSWSFWNPSQLFPACHTHTHRHNLPGLQWDPKKPMSLGRHSTQLGLATPLPLPSHYANETWYSWVVVTQPCSLLATFWGLFLSVPPQLSRAHEAGIGGGLSGSLLA